MTLAVRRLVRDLAARLPELGHVRASALLVVAGEARGVSRASIGPITARGRGGPKVITYRGRRLLYVMTLRPLWFLASTPEERVSTVIHELYHCSTRFDGTLHRSRKHARLARRAYDARVRALLGRYLARAPPEVLAPFAHEGLVRVRIWLRRPRAARRGAREVEGDLARAYLPLASRPRSSEGAPD